MENPVLGVFFHWLGGLSSATFYVPYRGAKGWSWEIFWLTGGLFSWLFAPWLFAAIQTHDLLGVLSRTPPTTIGYCVLFGFLWGFGGLTYGLTMRYLGLSLGMAVVLGLCTVFGTLIPPIFAGNAATALLGTASGRVSLVGLAITVIGIVVVAAAGARKNAALTAERKSEAIKEFDFTRGLLVAIFSGVMSSCYAYGLAAGEPVRQLSAAAGTGPLWVGLPVICLVTGGGLITNGLWCLLLVARNGSGAQWTGRSTEASGLVRAGMFDGAGEVGSDASTMRKARLSRGDLARNYALCALGGTLWYFQFFFYTMGESQMGRFGFSSWTIHMASIIIFGTIWGFALREWKDAAGRTRVMVWAGVGLLVLATVVIGYGNTLSS